MRIMNKRFKKKTLYLLTLGVGIVSTSICYASYVITSYNDQTEIKQIIPEEIKTEINNFLTIKSSNPLKINERVTFARDNQLINDIFSFELTFDNKYFYEDSLDAPNSVYQTDRAGLEIIVDFTKSTALYKFISTYVKNQFIYIQYNDFKIQANNIENYQYGYGNVLEDCYKFSDTNYTLDFVIPISEQGNKSNTNFYITSIVEEESNGLSTSQDSWDFNIVMDFDVLNKTYDYKGTFSTSDFSNLVIKVKGLSF